EKNRKGFTVIEWMKSILARTPEKLQSDAEFMKEQGMDEDAVDEIIRGSAVPGNPSEEYFDNIRLILEYLEEQSANQQSQLPAESQILEVSGSLISPNKKLKVELSNADHKLSFTHNLTQADQGIFTIDWTNHPGAFAYFDKENFAWVYDGNSRVLIAGMTNSIRLTFWDLTTWGNEIPQAIADRLPKQK
ncbi:MAG: hypothetical protein JXR23_10015, partial [Pontiellaceae bacterium]|nr:hypothetical protein [Pontiellaceae bacterium]